MFRKLTLHGRLLNPLYCRNASIRSTRWIRSSVSIRSQGHSSVKHYSASLALPDSFRDEIPQPPTTSDWLFQISPDFKLPSELGVPLPKTAIFLKGTIDWEAAERIFEKRPMLAEAINFGSSGYRDLSFLASLKSLTVPMHGMCISKYRDHDFKTFPTERPGYMSEKSLNYCYLKCNLPEAYHEPPFEITVYSTEKVAAQNAATLQLLLVLEEKQLLDVFLSLIPMRWISKEAQKALGNDIVNPSAEVLSVGTNGSSETISTPAAPELKPTAEINPAVELNPGGAMPRSMRVTLEIFNYAAKYLYIPRYTVTSQPNPTAYTLSNSTTSNGSRVPKRTVTVEIALPEHGIHATATGFSLGLVETMACVNFKQEVEKYHIANAVPSHSSEGPINLSTANASNFIDFYNQYNDEITFDVSWDGKVWTSQAFTKVSKNTREPLGQAITRNSSKAIKILSKLVAAVTLVKERPELLVNYTESLDPGTGIYLAKARPMKLELRQSSLDLMQRTVEVSAKLGLSKTLIDEPGGDNIRPLVRKGLKLQYSELAAQFRSRNLLRWHKVWNERRKKNKLPLTKRSAEVLSLVENNQYSILVGQTGSGKTTQLPQIILDSYIQTERAGACKIMCTQPRRIAAKSVAYHVAQERDQDLGDQVGYHISSDARLPEPRGSITYCTTGILLQQLIHQPDDLLDNISHLIIDEVHDRDLNIDFLLTMIKKLMEERIKAGKRTPKVCLMSATLDAEMLQEYFAFTNETGGEVICPILHVEGRAFPVEKHYLEHIVKFFEETYPKHHGIWRFLESENIQGYLKSEEKLEELKSNLSVDMDEKVDTVIEWDSHYDDPDSLHYQMKMDMVESIVPVDLAAAVIAHISITTENGAILVFLPGLRHIDMTEDALRTQRNLDVDFNDEDKFKIFRLHSSIPGGDEVFKKVPPGCRKIILATNIAETSITIDDIQYVVDTGKHKEVNFHQSLRILSLPCKWVSKSSVKQRSGRAGRVQNGTYYGLFSERRYESLRTTSRPEMLRVDLQNTCLEIKVLGYKESIRDFLASAPNPPSLQAVQSSIESLKTLGALTNTEKITPLGQLIAGLPMRPALGKMVILGIIYRCLDPMIILGALDDVLLQTIPPNMEEESDAAMRGFAKTSKSDHIAMFNAFDALRRLEKLDGPDEMMYFANKKFLSVPRYERSKKIVKLIQEKLQFQLYGLAPNGQEDDIAGKGAIQYGGALLNENSEQEGLIKALLVQGLHPHIGAWDSRQLRYQIVANEKVLVSPHTSSINSPFQRPKLFAIEGIKSPSKGNAPLLSFSSLVLVADNKLAMYRTTAVTPFMASLFNVNLNQSNVDIDQVEVDKWLPFDVRSTDKLRGAEGAAAQTLLKFNLALRNLEQRSFHDLAKREYIVDSEMSHILANSLKELSISEQDIDQTTEEHEWEFKRRHQKFWSPSETPPEEIPPLIKESSIDEDESYKSFFKLVEDALDRTIIPEIDSAAAASIASKSGYKSFKHKSSKESASIDFQSYGEDSSARETNAMHDIIRTLNESGKRDKIKPQNTEESAPNDWNTSITTHKVPFKHFKFQPKDILHLEDTSELSPDNSNSTSTTTPSFPIRKYNSSSTSATTHKVFKFQPKDNDILHLEDTGEASPDNSNSTYTTTPSFPIRKYNSSSTSSTTHKVFKFQPKDILHLEDTGEASPDNSSSNSATTPSLSDGKYPTRNPKRNFNRYGRSKDSLRGGMISYGKGKGRN